MWIKTRLVTVPNCFSKALDKFSEAFNVDWIQSSNYARLIMRLFYLLVPNRLHFKVLLSIGTERKSAAPKALWHASDSARGADSLSESVITCDYFGRDVLSFSLALYQPKTLKCKWMYRDKSLYKYKWFLSRIAADFACPASGILFWNCGMRNK